VLEPPDPTPLAGLLDSAELLAALEVGLAFVRQPAV
jgi:hypothetical protein